MSISVHDALIAPVWLAANALLLFAAWRLVSRLFAGDSLLPRIVHLIIVCWSYIVVAAFALGSTGALSGFSLLAAVAAMAVATLLVMRREGRGASRTALLPVVYAPRPSPERRWEFAWGVALAIAVGMVVDGALLQFPKDFDSLMYHIPQVDQWLRAGSLYAPDSEVWYNPSNNELLGFWIVAPFSGDFLIGLGNLPASALLALATVELSRGLGKRAAACHLAGFAAVANYVTWRQLLDSENDVAAAGLFVACLAYAVRFRRDDREADLWLSAASLGLLSGIKYYALGYAGVAGLGMTFLGWRSRGIEGARIAALAAVAGVVVLGGYWYLRNTLFGGAPLFPRGFWPDGDLLSKVRPDIWSSTLIGNGSKEIPGLLARTVWKSMGAAHLAACAVMPATILWLGNRRRSALCERSAEAEADARIAIIVCAIGAALVLAVTPFAVECTPGTMDMLRGAYLPARFGLSSLTLAMIAAVAALDDVGRRLDGLSPRWITHAPNTAFAVLAASQVSPARLSILPGNMEDGLLVACNILLLGASFVTLCTICPIRRGVRLMAPPLLALCVAAAGWLGQRWHDGFTPYYERLYRSEVIGLLARRDPNETRIGAMEYLYYPFFGSRRQFRVSKPIWLPSYQAFLQYLRDNESMVVVTVNREPFADGRFEHAKEWLDSDARGFAPLGSDHRFSAYRILSLSGSQE